MYYCVKCGTQVPDEAKFCSKCGQPKKIVGEKQGINNNSNSEVINVNPKAQIKSIKAREDEVVQSSNSSAINLVLIGAFIAIVIVVVAFGGYCIYEKNSELAKTKNSNEQVVEGIVDNKGSLANKQDSTSKDKKEEKKSEDTNKDNKSVDYIFNNSSEVQLTDSQLDSLSKENLAFARNEIFARHGYVFQTEPFKSYFNNKTWYKPNANFKGNEDELTETERYNVQLILKYESKK